MVLILKKRKVEKDISKEVKAYVRQQLKRNIELKRTEYDGFLTTGTNTGWVIAYPSQGTSSEQRLGDAFIMKHFHINADVFALTTNALSYRIVVFMADASSLVTAANLFIGGPGNYLQGSVDTNYVTPLMDIQFNTDSAQRLSRRIKQTKKMNKKISFLLGTQTPAQEYIHVWVGCCDASGTPVSGQARFVGNFQIGFTDA